MNKANIVLLVLLALLGNAICQKSVSVACATCGVSTCASGYCYKVTGDSLSQTICVAEGKTCNLALNATYKVNNCSYDYLSTACSTGICFYAANTQIALLGGSCSADYSQSITCGSCVGVTCTSNTCQSLKKTNMEAVVSCVDSCASPANVNMNIAACSGGYDQLGTQNGCCMTFVDTAGAVCSTQSTILTASTKIKSYVKGTSGFELSTPILLSFIILCLAMIL